MLSFFSNISHLSHLISCVCPHTNLIYFILHPRVSLLSLELNRIASTHQTLNWKEASWNSWGKTRQKPANLFPPGSRLVPGKVPLASGGLLFLPSTHKFTLIFKRDLWQRKRFLFNAQGKEVINFLRSADTWGMLAISVTRFINSYVPHLKEQ